MRLTYSSLGALPTNGHCTTKEKKTLHVSSQLKFLEVSQYSFVNGLGGKMHEGAVKKRSGGRTAVKGFLGCYTRDSCTNHWNER